MKTLYVSNLAPEIEEVQLRECFEAYGEVTEIEFGVEERPREEEDTYLINYALVTMSKEKNATKAMHGLNGQVLLDRRLAITPPDVSIKPLTAKQRKSLEEIAESLNETEAKPLRMLEAIVLLCGTSFAQALVEEALEVEEAGGLMTTKGDRRRTLGGVFFYLARYRMPHAIRRIVFNRKGRLPNPEADSEDEDQAAGAEH